MNKTNLLIKNVIINSIIHDEYTGIYKDEIEFIKFDFTKGQKQINYSYKFKDDEDIKFSYVTLREVVLYLDQSKFKNKENLKQSLFN